jgi:GrpB-like predicted nucleotidyltransferase (UPF0157 family)
MANPIIVLDYDPNGPGLFQSLRKRIADTLGDLAAIEHVGITAVPDLAAKPIIDIDALLAIRNDADCGHRAPREFGLYPSGKARHPRTRGFPCTANDPPHHLYVCPPCSGEFGRHMAFRDYLRSHPKEAKVYGDLKIALAERFREDRPAYNTAKTEFVAELTSRAIRYSEKVIDC